ncbi:plasmid pRiA4b ORF-3 family protein, partial [uncultured Bifidobacterium sp.]|uniref:plasmid pRiA4b ORF-3 family protein n=1 Tax=uncultured Bifidobacterium sp. TaxID=165187 RepID=UPI002599924B
MARKSKDVDRDPELIADMTLLMLYLLSGKVGRGRSARWVAPTHLDANALDQLVRDKLIEDNGDGSVTFTEQGLDGAQYVHDVFLETADVVDMLEERLLLLLALQHTDPKELLNELRGKKGQPAIAAKGDTAATFHAKNASSKSSKGTATSTTNPTDDYDPAQDQRAFRIQLTLRGYGNPLCWRLIEVPASYTFLDLHVIIQECMRWLDYHLFDFRFTSNGQKRQLDEHGDMYDDFSDWMTPEERKRQPVKSFSRDVHLGEIFPRTRTAVYSYDYGDGWEIDVKVVKTIKHRDHDEPLVLDGDGAAPPEDVGGPAGYADFLRTINGEDGPERQYLLEWSEDQGYLDHFDLKDTQERVADWRF